MNHHRGARRRETTTRRSHRLRSLTPISCWHLLTHTETPTEGRDNDETVTAREARGQTSVTVGEDAGDNDDGGGPEDDREVSGKKWNCVHCTFLNDESTGFPLICAVCEKTQH